MATNKSQIKYNKPQRTSEGPKKFVGKACQDGTEKIIQFGDSNMRIKKSDPKARKSFRARHKCSTAKSKLTARYWSCRNW